MLGYTLVLAGGHARAGPDRHLRAVYLVGAASARRRALRAGLAAVARQHARNAGVLFHYSLLYLALLFVAVAVDAAMR